MNWKRTMAIGLTVGLELAGGGRLCAQPAGSLMIPPHHPLDPIVPQLVGMGAAEGAVIAGAELEPAVTTPGQPVLLRMVVTAHSESAAQPDTLPVPPGVSFRVGGSSMSVVMTGRGIQFRTTFLYWLTATQAGTYTIPAFTISANSRDVPVSALTLTVVPVGSPDAVLPPKLEVEVPAGNFYVGQELKLPVRLLDAGDNSVFGLTGIKGEGNDFVFDSGMSRQIRGLQNYGGKTVAFLEDSMIAVPVREGRLPVVVQAQVFCRQTRPLQQLLPGYQPLFESLPAMVSVKHLPPGELPGFTGLIGHFTIGTPVVSGNPVRAGDPVELAVTVQGEGNLDRLVPPTYESDANWQVFPAVPDPDPPAVISQRQVNTFRYTLIPRQAGTLPTPKIAFSFFDPDRTAYGDLTVPSVSVVVQPPVAGLPSADTGAAANLAPAAPPANVLPPLARQAVHWGDGRLPWSERGTYWMGQLILAAGFAALWGWDARRRYLRAHPEVVRLARARRGFLRARQAMRSAAERRSATEYAQAAVAAFREASAPVAAANPEALVAVDILQALPPELPRSMAEPVVRQLFGALERLNYRGEVPAADLILAHSEDLERILDTLWGRLC